MTAVWAGMRVVYADRLHGEVLLVGPGAVEARLRLDNGTVDWFRTGLMVPEGEHDPQEETPGAWTDRAGFLWLEAGGPGSRRVFCYDAPARRRMGDKWPAMPLEDAEAEFGPMDPMVPVPQGPQGPQDDRVVFLYGGGRSVEVPAPEAPASFSSARVQGDGAQFAEVVPGWLMAMLAQGRFWVSEDECADGVFVVVRRKR